METVLTAGLLSAGKGFLAHMIYDSYDIIKETATYEHPYLQGILNELDLKADLQVIQSLLSKINHNSVIIQDEENEGNNSENNENNIKKEVDPILVCLQNVTQMVCLIKDELKNINEEIKKHDERWLANWRTPSYQGHINKIILHKKILDKRVDLLIKILQITT